MITVLASGWGVFVLALAARHRPAPARVRALRARALARSDGQARGRSVVMTGALMERVGCAVWRAAHAWRRGAAGCSAERARRLGGAVAAGVAAALVLPPLAPIAGGVCWWAPGARARARARGRQRTIAAAVPDAVDLLVLAVDAGMTVPLAVTAVAAHLDGSLGDEFRAVVAEVRLGRRTADAIDALAARAGEAVRPVATALAAAERYGAPLAGPLDRLATEARRRRRQEAEELARRLPVKLLFPLVCCTLPAFGLLTVAPLLAGAFRALRL